MVKCNHNWCHNGTVNLTIKKVPPEVYETLKNAAAESGRSLNAEAIKALVNAAGEVERRRRMKESRPALERFVSTLPRLSSSVSLIRGDRKRH